MNIWLLTVIACVHHSGDMTGAYSVHTIYEGHEIMFHVSTLLPYSKDNKQQVSDVSRAAHEKGKQSGLFQPAGPRAQNAIFHRWCSNESFSLKKFIKSQQRRKGHWPDCTVRCSRMGTGNLIFNWNESVDTLKRFIDLLTLVVHLKEQET